MANNQFLAGVGRALIFDGDNLIGVAKTLTESTFDFSISAEEVRGGMGNALLGKYFHDSNLAVTMTDAMFNLEYVAANLGVNIEQGGLTVYESPAEGEVVATAGSITLTHTPVEFGGSVIGWYKLPAEKYWKVATITGNTMAIPTAQSGDVFCVKYLWQNPNARQITIKSQYVPKVLHVIIMNDLYSGDSSDIGTATRYGRLITDIPSLQLDGTQNLNLTATSAATIPLSGNALAVEAGLSCEEDSYYGTMTEEIFGSTWQDNVKSLAIENADLELASGASETLLVYAVYGGSTASNRQPNSNFTFAVESGNATVTEAGVVTGGSAESVISITLKGHSDIVAYAHVEVA